jgi:response regulator of citrate/malate metabolism
LETGARDFLVNPLNKEKLLRKIDKYKFKKKPFITADILESPSVNIAMMNS